MEALTPISPQGESHIKQCSPSASPRFLQDPLDIIKSECITESHLAQWKAEDTSRVNIKLENFNTPPSATQRSCHQVPEAPPTPELDVKKFDPMSPSGNISINSSSQFYGCQSSSESEESEPWTLNLHELLPDHSTYAYSPSSPTSGWEVPVPYQFQGAPTSAGYYNDCSVPFSAAASPAMQTSYSPVIGTRSAYGSPGCPTSYFGDGSPTYQHPLNGGIPELGTMVSTMASPQDYPGVIATPTSDYSPTSDFTAERDVDINTLPYSQLLYRAFMSSSTKKLSLRNIYDWFQANTNKPKKNKGWQNSIRHNLSMNGAFQKAPSKEDGTESRRATEWILVESAVAEGVKSTTRYRRNTGRSKLSAIERERMSHSSYSGGRRAALGYNSRGRDKVYKDRFHMHGMPSSSHLMYGSPVTSPALAGGYPEVGGYMPPSGGVCYPPSQMHEGYNEHHPQDVLNSENCSIYNAGENTMGNYAIIGGFAEGAPVLAHASGVLQPPIGVPFVPPFSSGPTPSEEQNYPPDTYDIIPGMSIETEGGHE
ncbi:hypothetical protein PWT90_10420 [Aphanocladium album]|nr:hypothetical protein PWT90_10420 [Aphanocladium album]